MLSFHVKFVKIDRQTDGRTTVKQYAPDLSIRGHKNISKLIPLQRQLFKTHIAFQLHPKLQILDFQTETVCRRQF